MPISTIVKTLRDVTILFEDGTSPTTEKLTVAFEEGNLSLNIPGVSVEAFLDRGQFGATPALRYGNDQPITGSFTAYLRDLADGSYITLESILTNSGYFASTWVSTLDSAGNAEVKTVKMTITYEGTDHGDAADHTIVLAHCFITGSITDGTPSTVQINFSDFEPYPTVT